MAAQSPMGISTGTVIAGSYEVTQKIGQGGMGTVWAARHLRLPGKRVAIKVLRAGGTDEQGLARFRREAEIASRIGHPNIVEVLDFNTLDDGTPYQVLEFLDGESLAARLARGPVPVGDALEITRQIGSALRAAHRAGVVHRDLKPDNIFLCPSDAGGVLHHRVKVLDFGISKIRGSQTLQTQESVLIGTPQYMSPEQASGRNNEVDQRTDVFALGAIVYEMLSGQSAFSGEGLMAVIMAVIHAPPVPLAGLVPSLPGDVAAAVHRALAKDPAQRFAEVAEFITALTGRPLQTLGDETGASGHAAVTARGAAAGSGSRPLSADEINGETIAPSGATPGLPTPATPAPRTLVKPAAAKSPVPAAVPTLLQPPSAAAPALPPPRRRPLIIAGVALGAAALVAAGVVLGGAPRIPEQRAPPPTAPVAAKVPTSDAAAAADSGAASATTTPAADRPRATTESAGNRPRPETLPKEVADQLAEADRLLAAGDASEAIRRTRQSFFIKKSSRGWSLLTRAFCAKGDLENARASFRNLVAGSPDRNQATRDCHARGIDLR